MNFPFKVSECQPQELTTIGNRLLDWFSVIMTDTKKQKRRIAKSEARFPAACKVEAKWMVSEFNQLECLMCDSHERILFTE